MFRFWTTLFLIGVVWCGLSSNVAWGQAPAQKKTTKASTLQSGIIAKVLVKEGDAVKVGQVLAQLDAKEALAELKIAQTNVEIALVKHKAAEASKQEAEGQYKRILAFGNKAAEEEKFIKKFYLDKMIIEQDIRFAESKIAKLELEKAEWFLLLLCLDPARP